MPEQNVTTKFKADVSGLVGGLKQADAQLRVIKSEFASVSDGTKSWEKSVDGIQKHLEILGRQLEQQNNKLEIYKKELATAKQYQQEQKQKVDDLKKALAEATEKYGENSDEVKNLEKELKQAQIEEASMDKKVQNLTKDLNYEQGAINKTNAEINRLNGKLEEAGNETSNADKDVKTLSRDVDDLGESSNEASSKIGELAKSVAVGLAKSIAVGIATVGAGVVKLTKDSISMLSEFEQLEGGIKTLYGTKERTVKEYAKAEGKTTKQIIKEYKDRQKAEEYLFKQSTIAYREKGMSENEYLEKAITLNGALMKATKNRASESAKLADLAMQLISDNVNKLGTDFDNVSNAIMGLTKENYTMMDNLALGYAGNRKGVEQLVNDAAKLKKVQEDLKIKINPNDLSIDNILKAIQVIQEFKEINGTTMKEAQTTISGSLTMMKKSWENLLTAIGKGDQKEIEQATNNLINSFDMVVKKLGPVLENVLKSIGTFLDKIAPKIIKWVDDNKGTFASILGTLWDVIYNLLETSMPAIIDALSDILMQILDKTWAKIKSKAKSKFSLKELFFGKDNESESDGGHGTGGDLNVDDRVKLSDDLNTNKPSSNPFKAIFEGFEDNMKVAEEKGKETGAKYTKGVEKGAKETNANLNVIEKSSKNDKEKAIQKGHEIKNAYVNAIKPNKPNLLEQYTAEADKAHANQKGKAIGGTLKQGIKDGASGKGNFLTNAMKELDEQKGVAKTRGKNIGSNVKTGIKQPLNNIKSDMQTVGSNVDKGIEQGVENNKPSLLEKIGSLCKDMLGWAKKKLGIESPSKVFRDKVGVWIGRGIASGINKSTKDVNKSINNLVKSTVSTAKSSFKSSGFETVAKNIVNSFTKTIDKSVKESTNQVKNLVSLKSADFSKTVKSTKKSGKTISTALFSKEDQKKYKTFLSNINKQYQNTMSNFQKNAKTLVSNAMDNVSKQYEEKFKRISDAYNNMTNKLTNFGDIITKVNDNLIVLNDIDAQTKAIEEYQKTLKNLKKSVSAELFDYITSLDVDTGKVYAETLLNMSKEQLKAYDKSYVNKLKTAEKLSNDLYKDDISKLNKAYNNAVDNALKDVSKKVNDLGKQAINGLITGMKGQTKNLGTEVQKLANTLIKQFKKSLKIKSPSRRLADEIGKFVPLGLAQGIKENTKGLINEVKSMSEQVVATARGLDINNIMPDMSNVRALRPNSYADLQGYNGNVYNYTFNQTNTSPKALDRLEIYKQTQQQLNFAKLVMNNG